MNNEETLEFLKKQLEKEGFSDVTNDLIIEKLREAKFKNCVDTLLIDNYNYKPWDEYRYVVRLYGTYISFYDGYVTGDVALGDVNYSFDITGVLEAAPVEELTINYYVKMDLV